MASITYDGQSFLLDGRRVWLVSGSIPFSRIPRAEWSNRILAAKHAGLNCVETPVVWARHEPRQGQFDFTGDNDIREFVKLVHAAGMFCMLRPGPFIDSGYDLGGLPPWLVGIDNLKLRTANQPFLEACSRYITALAGQVRDLQVNSPTPKGSPAGTMSGPIILIQNEHAWTCGDDHLAQTYLGELDRYYRESGFGVPIVNTNELWQDVEGEIDGWTGYDQLLSHLRQLGSIKPAQPRIVVEFKVGQPVAWNSPAPEPRSPSAVLRRLAEILAAGGQFNIDPFCGGTYFGFSAGRDPALGHDGFLSTSADAGACISETGEKTPLHGSVRRICTFASRFSRVLSHLDPARQPVTLMPESPEKGSGRVAVMHAVGSQGGVVFVFGDDHGHNTREPMNLLLPDGSTLPVDLGDQSVVWCLLETRLTGRANLDYCNLSALALVGKVFICFGAAGARAALSINGSPLETTVPEGKNPVIQEHEGITVVIANREQVDEIFFDDSAPATGGPGIGGTGVYIGVAGLDSHGKPVPRDEHQKSCIHIDVDGKQTPHKFVHASGSHAPAKRHARPHLGEWAMAGLGAFVDGTSPRFASITKPSDLVTMGAPYGYGWYRLKLSSSSAHKARLMFPHAGHRLHMWLNGEHAGLIGVGPGSSGGSSADIIALSLAKGSNTLVVLAENFGRASSGADLGELTGIHGHAWEVEPIKPGKPKLTPADPVDPLAFRAPLWRIHREDRTDSQRLTWTIDHRRKTPIIIDIGPFEQDAAPEREGGLVLLNGKPVHYFQQGGVRPLFLDPALLAKGNNEIQITLMGSTEACADALAKHVHFHDAVDSPTMKADWSFGKWEPPAAGAYGKNGKHAHGQPAFWKSVFTPGDGTGPLLLDVSGMTKGQVWINGKHLGRFFVATATGKRVPPQTRLVVPRSWLKPDANNDLVLFDEHGHTPTKVKLTEA